jgi:hypothetical protein
MFPVKLITLVDCQVTKQYFWWMIHFKFPKLFVLFNKVQSIGFFQQTGSLTKERLVGIPVGWALENKWRLVGLSENFSPQWLTKWNSVANFLIFQDTDTGPQN